MDGAPSTLDVIILSILNILSGHDMSESSSEHTLEFLLAFNGRIHHLEDGYWIKFEIKRVEVTAARPHGLSYSFTLHAPDGKRLVGFDNAHAVAAAGSRLGPQPKTNDHWHRTRNDPGRPYEFTNAETLVEDFFNEVERVLAELGVSSVVVGEEERRSSK